MCLQLALQLSYDKDVHFLMETKKKKKKKT